MINNQDDMKKFVENLIQQLKASGIQVNSAALLNLSGNGEGKPNLTPPLPGQVDMNKVNSILKEMRDGGFPQPSNLKRELDLEKGDSEDDVKTKCFCPNCYNYDTFESVHQEDGSIFDQGEVKLNGFTFKVKYHLGIDGSENFIIKKDTTVDLSGFGFTELQAELTKAVQDKNFAYSQQILNEIQERKNKN